MPPSRSPAHSSRCSRSSSSSTDGAMASIIRCRARSRRPSPRSSRSSRTGGGDERRAAAPKALKPPRGDGPQGQGSRVSAPAILGLMTLLFLCFGYLGVPVAFSLLAGVFIGAAFTDVTFPAIVQKIFDGMDSEALLAIPFFLLVGELMSSANVVSRI